MAIPQHELDPLGPLGASSGRREWISLELPRIFGGEQDDLLEWSLPSVRLGGLPHGGRH